ncbi:MAG: Na+/H+ antiporter NhaC family protein [Anaerolineales bacterium]
MDYGFLSILPPLAAIVLAIATRQVIVSMFVAIWLGASILNSNIITGFFRTVDTHLIYDGIAKDGGWYAGIIVFTLVIAGTLALVTKSGGAQAIAEAVALRAKNARGGMLGSFLMGLIVFFDDYSSCIIAGNTARPISDRLKISREKLSYIIDSTAAPIATIALISTWIGFELGVIADGYNAIGIENAPVYAIFLASIPYRFYSIFALAMVLIIAISMKDFGPMYHAEVRARTTGKLLRDGASPLAAEDTALLVPTEATPKRWYNFVIPVLVIMVVMFAGLYVDGGGLEGGMSVTDAFSNADSLNAMLWASFLGCITALVLVLVQRLISLQEAVDTIITGAKAVLPACIILVLAWSLSSVTSELGAANYLVGLIEGSGLAAPLLPLVIFLISCMMAFAMGTSWGTMGIVTPLAIPIALALGGESFLIPTLGAVLTGAIFGDHCSPISDTTILSSTGAGSDHIDHVRTQIPYAITGAVVAAVFGFLPAGFGVHPLISIVLGIAALIIFVRFVGKSTENAETIAANK